MDELELKTLEEKVVEELSVAIQDFVEYRDDYDGVKDLQPTMSTIKAMATAAAQVLIAFERGYQMNDSE